MRSRFIKSAALTCACAASVTVFGGVAKAQLQGWTVESVRLGGALVETGSGATIEILPRLDGLALPAGQTGVSLTVYDGVPEPGTERTGGVFEASTTGAKYIVRVKGPVGCTGQTHTLSFLVESYADAHGVLDAPATYEDWGTGEADILELPSPTSKVAVSSGSSVGGASSSAEINLQGPPSQDDSKVNHAKALLTREVTFDATEHANVEIPFALKVKGKYAISVVDSMGDEVEVADGRSGAVAVVGFDKDTRSVQINSGSIEDSYRKEGTARVLNKRNPDGSIQTDSAVSWLNSFGTWSASSGFSASTPGFTWPTYTWNYTGAGQTLPGSINLNLQGDHPWVVLGQQFGSSANAFPASGMVKVDITDGPGTDGVSGSNTFSVRWHLPFENWTQYQPATEVVDVYRRTEEEALARSGSCVPGKWTFNNLYVGATADAISAISSVAGNMVGNPVWGGFFAALGVASDEVGEQSEGENQTVCFDIQWSKPHATFDPPKQSSYQSPAEEEAHKQFYQMEPMLRVIYQMKYLEGEQYDTHGYVGMNRRVAKAYKSLEYSGQFTAASTENPVDPS